MTKVGLVLEGGGMRGAYTAGVLDAFLDMGIHFKDIIGVSAGAANAISYVSEQHGRNLEIYKRFPSDDRYLSFKSFLKTGSFFGMQFVFYEVTRNLLPFDYSAFKNSDMKLTAVCTNVKNGKAFYKELDDINDDNEMKYLCASAAIPMASTIVKVDGHKLMDGGASDSIPIEYSLSKGNLKNIIVLTRNEGFRQHKTKAGFFAHLRYLKYQKFAHTVANRHEYYNKSLDIAQAQEKNKQALIIRPQHPIVASRFERSPEVLTELYHQGYEETLAIHKEILNFLQDAENVTIK
ncbi:MAG: patatin family protein [Christensenellaceae bacterium]